MPASFLSSLLAHQTYVITSHIRPDGDAVGSVLALGRVLSKLGKEVLMVISDPTPYNLDWLSAHEPLEVFEEKGTLEQRAFIVNVDAVVVVDTNARHRLGEELGRLLRQNRGEFFLIDHHPKPESWFAHTYVRTSASSTGELLYELIEAQDLELIDTPIATALYTAIMTDTGSFRFNSVTPRVHEIIADLLQRGNLNPEPIHVNIFNQRTLSSYRLLGMALESIRLMYNGRVGYMVITQDMLYRTGAMLDETEGFVDYVLSIEGVDVAVIFLDLKQNVKASFRSVGEDLPVNEWARHFGGGGHRNAAGAYMKGSVKRMVPKIMNAAPRFLDVNEETATA